MTKIDYQNLTTDADQLTRSRNLWRAAAIGFMITTVLLMMAIVVLCAVLGWNTAWR